MAVSVRARALVHAPKIAVLFIARACAMTDRRLDRHLMGICHMFATYTAMHRYVFDIEPACCMWLCVCARVPWYCIVSIVWVSCFIGTGIVLYRIVSVLYCTVLYCTVSYRIVSYRIGIVLYCIVLYRIVSYSSVLVALYCIVVYRIVLYRYCKGIVLYCSALHCSVLYCIVLYCICSVLHCIRRVLYCSVL